MTAPCPIETAARLAGRPGRVLLHSASDADGRGRWSFAAADPVQVVEARGDEVSVRDGAGVLAQRFRGDPIAVVDELVRAHAAGADRWPLPVAIGYIGYDHGRQLLPRLGPGQGGGEPDVWFGIYPAVWRFDHATGQGEVAGADAAARERLARAIAAGPRQVGAPPVFGPLEASRDGEAAYRAGFARAIEYIGAGDVYQINLARRLCAPIRRAGDPLAVYAALARTAPMPYGAVIETGNAAVVSSSPELFLSRAAGSPELETRPIKGTRRRTGDPAIDAALAAELARDDKERAEHLMIVDLERNDLGRIAATGTVRVDGLGPAAGDGRFGRVVELDTVLHMVSTVRCQLRPGVTVSEIVRATFPGGSITGAPKLRAMQVIDELEPFSRGVYTGAIGGIGAGGAIELSVAIRTAVMSAGELSVCFGGGVVADSSLAREWEETEEKAAAWRIALARMIPHDG